MLDRKVRVLKNKQNLDGTFILFDNDNNTHVSEPTLEISMRNLNNVQMSAQHIAFLQAEKANLLIKLSAVLNMMHVLHRYLQDLSKKIGQSPQERQIQKNREEIDKLKAKEKFIRHLHAFQPAQYWYELVKLEKQIQSLEQQIQQQLSLLQTLENIGNPQSLFYDQALNEEINLFLEMEQQQFFYTKSATLTSQKINHLEQQIQTLILKLQAEVHEIITRCPSDSLSFQGIGLFAINPQIKREPIDVEKIMQQLQDKIKQLRVHNTSNTNCGYWAEYVLLALEDLFKGKPCPDRYVPSDSSSDGTTRVTSTKRHVLIKLENGDSIDSDEVEYGTFICNASSKGAFAHLPPTIENIYNLETGDKSEEVINLNSEKVLMTRSNVFELNNELKTKAAAMPEGVVWGIIALQSATEVPYGHLITFCATRDDVYYIDPQRFDVNLPNDPISNNLPAMYNFSREKQNGILGPALFDTCFYLVSQLSPGTQNRPGLR